MPYPSRYDASTNRSALVLALERVRVEVAEEAHAQRRRSI
jgi:hypothetical protein